jgi:hypothetical protein
VFDNQDRVSLSTNLLITPISTRMLQNEVPLWVRPECKSVPVSLIIPSKLNTLCFPARKRGALLTQRNVSQTYILNGFYGVSSESFQKNGTASSTVIFSTSEMDFP